MSGGPRLLAGGPDLVAWGTACMARQSLPLSRPMMQRLRVAFGDKGSVREVCANGLRQLRALSARERRKLYSRVQGICLWQRIEILEASTAPSRASHPVVSHVQPPNHSAPALLIWLRTFQRSCTR
uniref:RxLR effector candidate protein n=1 Tax=Hyaloperonospora arabidopsidis (strain Emoy2) TaxID=559515 RepID=M4BRB0_HYAAE